MGLKTLAAFGSVIRDLTVSTAGFVNSFLADLEVAFPEKKTQIQGLVHHKPVSPWIRPTEGMVKINCDGAVARDGRRGSVAAVCRRADGLFLEASARVIEDLTDPASLEAMACVEALALAVDLNEQHISNASDCLEVINNLHDDQLPSYGALLRRSRCGNGVSSVQLSTTSDANIIMRHTV